MRGVRKAFLRKLANERNAQLEAASDLDEQLRGKIDSIERRKENKPAGFRNGRRDRGTDVILMLATYGRHSGGTGGIDSRHSRSGWSVNRGDWCVGYGYGAWCSG